MTTPSFETASCDLCGSSKSKKMYPYDTIWVVRCLSCGMYYRSSRLSESEYLNYYSKKAFDYVNQNKSRSIIYETEIPFIMRYVPNRSGRLLDIGCSDGYFLRLMARAGWHNLHGIEVSHDAADHAREQFRETIYSKPLIDCSLPENTYSAVTLWDVLDHLRSPKKELQEIHRIMKKDGIIVIRLRNANFHILALTLTSWLTKHVKIFEGIIHNHGFTRKTLSLLLEKSGFTLIGIKNAVPSKNIPDKSGDAIMMRISSLIKISIFILSQIIAFFTGKRILTAPSIIAYARK